VWHYFKIKQFFGDLFGDIQCTDLNDIASGREQVGEMPFGLLGVGYNLGRGKLCPLVAFSDIYQVAPQPIARNCFRTLGLLPLDQQFLAREVFGVIVDGDLFWSRELRPLLLSLGTAQQQAPGRCCQQQAPNCLQRQSRYHC